MIPEKTKQLATKTHGKRSIFKGNVLATVKYGDIIKLLGSTHTEFKQAWVVATHVDDTHIRLNGYDECGRYQGEFRFDTAQIKRGFDTGIMQKTNA